MFKWTPTGAPGAFQKLWIEVSFGGDLDGTDELVHGRCSLVRGGHLDRRRDHDGRRNVRLSPPCVVSVAWWL